MSKLLCPNCKSENLSANKKGFSGKKAFAGALLFGGIGILAGTIGNNKIIITCLNCGNEFGIGEGYEDIKVKNDFSNNNESLQVTLNNKLHNINDLINEIILMSNTSLSYGLLENNKIKIYKKIEDIQCYFKSIEDKNFANSIKQKVNDFLNENSLVENSLVELYYESENLRNEHKEKSKIFEPKIPDYSAENIVLPIIPIFIGFIILFISVSKFNFLFIVISILLLALGVFLFIGYNENRKTNLELKNKYNVELSEYNKKKEDLDKFENDILIPKIEYLLVQNPEFFKYKFELDKYL